MEPWMWVALFAVLFVATHLALSHLPIRNWQIDRMGYRGFMAWYTLVSFVFFLPMTWFWWVDPHDGPMLWNLRGVPGSVEVTEVVCVLALGLFLGSYARPAPSSLASKAKGELQIRGMSVFTRHPLFWSLNLWALAHMAMNGWASDLAFYGSMLVVGILGGIHQDHRKRQTNPNYEAYISITTFVPVLRPRLFRQIGARAGIAATVGIAVGVVLRYFHASLFS